MSSTKRTQKLKSTFLAPGRGGEAGDAGSSSRAALPFARSEDARVCTGLNSSARLLGWDAPGLLLQHCYTTAVMKKIQLQKLFVSASAPASIGETQAAMVQRLLAGPGRADYLPGGLLLFAATRAEEFPGDEKKSQGCFIE